MSGYENKNRVIGFLSSLLLHILLFFLLFMLLHEKQEMPSSKKRKTLNLSQFKTQNDEVATKAIPKPQPQTNVQKPQKPPQKNVSKKIAKPLQESAVVPKSKIEQNITAKPSKKEPPTIKNPLLNALNSEFKKMGKEAGGPIKKLYGDEFDRLSKEEQKYIKDNLGSIGKITERYLRYPDIAAQMGHQGTSLLEFYLHPNGDITDLKLLSTSGYKSLDKNSLQTIEVAYKDYPRPSVKTKIRIFVGYHIY